MRHQKKRTAIAALIVLSAPYGLFAQSRGWTRGGEGVTEGFQSSPLLVDLDSNGRQEIVLPAFDDYLHIYNHDGTIHGNGEWPTLMNFCGGATSGCDGTSASASYGDVDGDGDSEIVVIGDDGVATNARLRVFQTDGSSLANILLNTAASGKATACLIDCYRYEGTNRHPAKEIIVRDGDGRIHILRWNGSTFTNLYSSPIFDTVTLENDQDRFGRFQVGSSVAAISRDSNTTLIVASSTDGSVHRWRVDSDTTNAPDSNWEVSKLFSLSGGGRFFSSPALLDADGDSHVNIIVGCDDGLVYFWDWNEDTDVATPHTGWPKSVESRVISSPAIADLDDDGMLDIVAASTSGMVYAWSLDGTLLQGWPQQSTGGIYSSPVVADIDGVSGLEIVVTTLGGYIHVLSNTGIAIDGWPKRLNTPIYSSASIADLRNSRRRSIVIAGSNGKIFCFDLAERFQPVANEWPLFRGGPARLGNVP